MKVYTKTGDQGQTSLFSGGRVAKTDARLEAYGTIDELNSILGLLRTESLPDEAGDEVENVQHCLFEISSKVADPDNRIEVDPQVWATARLESWIDKMSDHFPPLKSFILPGGTRSAALAHFARTVCRRAERRLIEADELFTCAPVGAVAYLNRLSDALFVLARFVNHHNGVTEPQWTSQS